MATKTFEELKQLAVQIRDEKTNKQNTATRIGTQMLEHLNKLEQDYYDKTATDEELKQRDEKLTELSTQVNYYIIAPSSIANVFEKIERHADNNIVIDVSFNKDTYGATLGIGGILDIANGFVWCTCDDLYTLSNGDGLVINSKVKKIEKLEGIFGNAYKQLNSTDKIFLAVNLYGNLWSPHPIVQQWYDQLINGTKYISLNGGEIKNAIEQSLLSANRYVISSQNNTFFFKKIEVSGNNLTIAFADTGILLGLMENDPNSYGGLSLNPTEEFTLSNGQGLVVDQTNKKIITLFIYGYQWDSLKSYNYILIGINLYGKLWSPFPSIQNEFDDKVNGTRCLKLNGGEIAEEFYNKLGVDEKTFGENLCYTSKVILKNNQAEVVNEPYKIDKTETPTGFYAESIDDSNNDSSLDYVINNVPKFTKARFVFSYTCENATNIYAAIYEMGKSGWINNEGYTKVALKTTQEIVTEELERDYEEGVNELHLTFGRTNGLIPFLSGTNLKIYSCKCVLIGNISLVEDGSINYTEIEVEADGTFCKIRQAIKDIVDASYNNRYRLKIKNGNYNEIDIQTKDYVDVEGESKDGVVIYCDGQSTENAPEEYGWSGTNKYSGTPINTIPKAWKHLMIHMSNSAVRYLTMVANQTKYVIHQDNQSNHYEAVCENCEIIKREDYSQSVGEYDKGLLNLIGVGANEGQYQIYRYCNFRLELKNSDNTIYFPAALFWHNWNNKTIPCGATLEKCNVFGTNIAALYELGSDTDDVINILDVKVDNPKFGILYTLTRGYYRVDGEVTNDPEKVPYCIRLNLAGTDANFVLLEEDRIKGIDKVENASTICISEIDNALIGQPISITRFGWGKTSISDGNGDWEFAMENSSDNDSGYIRINKGNVGMGLAVAGNYAIGDNIYISNGKFTKSQTGEVVGKCFKSANIESDGLIPICKVK